MVEEKNEKAGVLALICSCLFPLFGVVCYIAYKGKVENASSYLWCAFGGFFVALLLAS